MMWDGWTDRRPCRRLPLGKMSNKNLYGHGSKYTIVKIDECYATCRCKYCEGEVEYHVNYVAPDFNVGGICRECPEYDDIPF